MSTHPDAHPSTAATAVSRRISGASTPPNLARATLAAALLAMLAAGAPAQDVPEGEERLDFEFGGGSVREFIEQFNAVASVPLNVVVPVGAEQVTVPEMQLRGVTGEDVTAVLNAVGEQNEGVRFQLMRTTDSTWVLATENRDEDASQVAFHPVGNLLESTSIEDLSATIATAWEMLGLPGSALEHIKFHEDTRLLIATGSPEVLGLVESAIAALGAEQRSAVEAAMRAEVEKAQGEVDRTRYQAEMEMQLAKEKTAMMQDELRQQADQLRAENAELRAALRELESELAKSELAKSRAGN
jgi:hypothetical protein